MDIEKLKILSKKASEAGELVRAVTAFKNELKDKEHMHDITMSGHFKTLRDPLIEQQKKTDEKQDKVIEQLQKNQLALTSGIKSLMPPQLMWDEKSQSLPPASPEEFSDSDFKSLPPTSPQEISESLPSTSPQEISGDKKDPTKVAGVSRLTADINSKFNKKEKEIIDKNELMAPVKLLDLSVKELKEYIPIVRQKSKDIGYKIGPKKRYNPDDPEISVLENEKEIVNSYGRTVNDVINYWVDYAIPKKGKGLKQPKRNAYKIQDGSYGGLLIDLPKLMNEMKIDVFRGGKLLYSADADKSLIDLLTKRFNPKTKYSINAVKIFNDLNTLANLPKHRSSGKTRMVGSSVTYYNDPNQLADRMKVLIGSMAAGNNSPLNINDLSQINDELLRIGAIDSSLHEKFFKKYLSQ